jgi:hypothetical protein
MKLDPNALPQVHYAFILSFVYLTLTLLGIVTVWLYKKSLRFFSPVFFFLGSLIFLGIFFLWKPDTSILFLVSGGLMLGFFLFLKRLRLEEGFWPVVVLAHGFFQSKLFPSILPLAPCPF